MNIQLLDDFSVKKHSMVKVDNLSVWLGSILFVWQFSCMVVNSEIKQIFANNFHVFCLNIGWHFSYLTKLPWSTYCKTISLFQDIQCLTNSDGPQVNKPCLFPWQLEGKWYSGCTTDNDPDGKFWCSTKLDKQLQHIGGEGNWGICRQSCISTGDNSYLNYPS